MAGEIAGEGVLAVHYAVAVDVAGDAAAVFGEFVYRPAAAFHGIIQIGYLHLFGEALVEIKRPDSVERGKVQIARDDVVFLGDGSGP